MNESSNQSTSSFDTDTPIRLPKTSLLSDKDLMRINLSQDGDDEDNNNEIFWSDTEATNNKDALETCQSTEQRKEEIQEKENKQKSSKKRKRLMKYDSEEMLKVKKNKREAKPGNKDKIAILLNPVKIQSTRSNNKQQ